MLIVPSLAPLIRDHHVLLCNKRTTSQIEICSWCGGRNDKFQRRLESSSAKRDTFNAMQGKNIQEDGLKWLRDRENNEWLRGWLAKMRRCERALSCGRFDSNADDAEDLPLPNSSSRSC